MRKIGFETSKGKFLVIDDNDDWFCGLKFNYYGDAKYDFFPKDENSDDYFSYVKKYKLSEIPEEQASEIVDYPFELEVADYSVLVFKDYEDDENTYTSSIFKRNTFV